MSAPQASQGGFATHPVDPTNSTGAQAIADECGLLRRRIRTLEAEVRGIRLAFEGILVRGTGQPTLAPPYIPSSPCLDSYSMLPSPAPTSSRGSRSEEEFFKLFVPFGEPGSSTRGVMVDIRLAPWIILRCGVSRVGEQRGDESGVWWYDPQQSEKWSIW
ncbi:hypothetical protein LTR27_004955 [Elasticomyces elasticus]|nr:hypothetical protein LTR27_004955 [Elasticomyces elasticus]